jgi:hypothetical protein
VIVAKFYDVESGRNTIENRGRGNAHEHLNIPIDRDGGIADLLAEAKRPDRRFVAVVCESIERVARVTYFSTKIEFELENSGVALLAADEGIDSKSIPCLNQSDAPTAGRRRPSPDGSSRQSPSGLKPFTHRYCVARIAGRPARIPSRRRPRRRGVGLPPAAGCP